MAWAKPLAAKRAFKDVPCGPDLLLMTHLVLRTFPSSSGLNFDELAVSSRSLLRIVLLEDDAVKDDVLDDFGFLLVDISSRL